MAGEFREHLRQRLPGVLARGDGHQFRVRMVQQQADEFFAGITRRADDGNFFRFHIQILPGYRRVCDPNLFRRNVDTRSPKQKTPPD